MNIVEALSEYGTPAYIYDLRALRDAADRLRAALPAGATLLYSLKANPHPFLVRELASRGWSAEVSSPGELSIAAGAGMRLESSVYTGPGKGREEIAAAVRNRMTISIESATDLRKVNEVAIASGARPCALLRVNSDVALMSRGLAMGGTASQFGLDASKILVGDGLTHGSGDPAELIGLHFYSGTNVQSVSALLATIAAAIVSARDLSRALRLELKTLDLGGGFPWPYARAGGASLRGFRQGLEACLDRDLPTWRSGRPQLVFESGRFVVAGCGSLVTTVQDVKVSKGRTFVVLDTGINHLGGMAGLRRIPSAMPTPDRLFGPGEAGTAIAESVSLVGPLCTPLDVLGSDVHVPRPRPGDVLRIPNVGAYGLTASLLGFLSRPPAVEIVADGDAVRHVSQLHIDRRVHLEES